MAYAYKIGLLSSSGKYLTTDFDGNVTLTQLDSSVNKLAKGQQWTLEGESSDGIDDVVTSPTYAIYSTNGHYLTVDKSGKVTADAEEAGKEQQFEIDAGGGGSGGWVLHNVVHDTYLGIKIKKVLCKKREACSSDQRWYVRLAVHPHCSLYNDGQNTYARAQGGRLVFDAAVPWKSDALLELRHSDGYGYFRATDGKYLTREGKFDRDISPQCLFVFQVTGDRMRLKDYSGLNLSVNTRGRLLSTTGRDRTSFALRLSLPHVILHQKVKGSWMRIFAKEGSADLTSIDATAVEEHEDETIFELSPLSHSTTPNSKWSLVTVDKRCLNVDPEGKLCVSKSATHNAKQFEFEFGTNSFILRHSHSNNWVTIDQTGKPILTSAINDARPKLGIELTNRPKLILRGEFGFIKRESGGRKHKVKCDSTEYDDLTLTYEPETNTYRVKGPDGLFWAMDSLKEHVIASDVGQPTSFIVEIHATSGRALLTLRPMHQDDIYFLKGYKNGALTATGESLSKDTMWEFY